MGLLAIRIAAKKAHKSREYVRRLIERGELVAIRSGGSDHAPRLRVDPVELEAAIKRSEVYVPKSMRQNSKRRPASASIRTLHRAAAAM